MIALYICDCAHLKLSVIKPDCCFNGLATWSGQSPLLLQHKGETPACTIITSTYTTKPQPLIMPYKGVNQVMITHYRPDI